MAAACRAVPSRDTVVHAQWIRCADSFLSGPKLARTLCSRLSAEPGERVGRQIAPPCVQPMSLHGLFYDGALVRSHFPPSHLADLLLLLLLLLLIPPLTVRRYYVLLYGMERYGLERNGTDRNGRTVRHYTTWRDMEF